MFPEVTSKLTLPEKGYQTVQTSLESRILKDIIPKNRSKQPSTATSRHGQPPPQHFVNKHLKSPQPNPRLLVFRSGRGVVSKQLKLRFLAQVEDYQHCAAGDVELHKTH